MFYNSARRLYQIDEDDFCISVLINKLFSSNKFTSNKKEAFLIDSFSLFVHMFLCIHAVLKA